MERRLGVELILHVKQFVCAQFVERKLRARQLLCAQLVERKLQAQQLLCALLVERKLRERESLPEQELQREQLSEPLQQLKEHLEVEQLRVRLKAWQLHEVVQLQERKVLEFREG